ncbi:MAG: hypothetical protein R2762_06015 [Bryobacteraceae bacterium]
MEEDAGGRVNGVERGGGAERATAAIGRAIEDLIRATPEAMERVEVELRRAAEWLGAPLAASRERVAGEKAGDREAERAALIRLRSELGVASRLLHQAASVRFSLAAQMYGAAESYTASGRKSLAIRPDAATRVAQG